MKLFHRFTISPEYAFAWQRALLVQAIFLLLTALVVDFGHTHWCATAAILAHNLAMGMIVFRRPDAPTKYDLVFFRYGYFLILVVTMFIAPQMHIWLNEKTLLDRWFGLRLMPPEGMVYMPALVGALIWICAYPFLAARRKTEVPSTEDRFINNDVPASNN